MSGRRVWGAMRESFWILLICLVALFVFLLALGAYSPSEVVGLTLVMVVLFLLWLGHAMWVTRHAEQRGPRAIAASSRTKRWVAPRSRVKIAAERPNSTALARAMASSRSPKRYSEQTGPKTSSQESRWSSPTSSKTVGETR